MPSFARIALLVVVGAISGGRVVNGAALPKDSVATPTITAAPDVETILARQIGQPDAVSLAQVLLTAIPQSLREVAVTNLPAVSSILWEDFLDDNKPQWFLDLPEDVQGYLIKQFGPSTAWPTETPASSGVDSSVTGTESVVATTQTQISESSGDASQSRSAVESTNSPSFSISGQSTTIATSVSAPSSDTSASSASSSSRNSSSRESTDAAAFPTSTSSPSTQPEDAPPSSDSGLSQGQKIGIGVGVPIAILGAAALIFGCCFLLRRRQRRKTGSVPPSSPGFIPRFAFQEKWAGNDNADEHREPLTQPMNPSTHDLGYSTWEDDVMESMDSVVPYPPQRNGGVHQQQRRNAPMMKMNDPKPIMAPALYHTHSSNRARGMRTSYQSLQAVTEMTEPDDEQPTGAAEAAAADTDSPVPGRHNNAHPTSPKTSPDRQQMHHRSITPPPVPAAARIKRKPIASKSPTAMSPAAEAASQTLLRQTMPEHSGSSSSGLAISSLGSYNSSSHLSSEGLRDHPAGTEDEVASSVVSPITEHGSPTNSNNPFSNHHHYPHDPFTADAGNSSNNYSYVEDYGPEFHHGHEQVGGGNNEYNYVDTDGGHYGGHSSFSRYPPSEPARSFERSRTEWPLRNLMGRGGGGTGHSGYAKNNGALWDRVYDG